MSKPANPSTYKSLVKIISQELAEFEFLIKRQAARTQWNIGRYIHKHLLENKDRANYGATLFIHLAKDTGRDASSLSKAVRFYRTYPILAETPKLTWEHYKGLITIKDEKERKKLEEKVIRNEWTTTDLRKYLSSKHKLAGSQDGKSVLQLKFTRGRLDTYQIVKASFSLAAQSGLALDLA